VRGLVFLLFLIPLLLFSDQGDNEDSDQASIIAQLFSIGFNPKGVEDIVEYYRIMDFIKSGKMNLAKKGIKSFNDQFQDSPLNQKLAWYMILIEYYQVPWKDFLLKKISVDHGLSLFHYLVKNQKENQAIHLGERLIRTNSKDGKLTDIMDVMEKWYQKKDHYEQMKVDPVLMYNYAWLLYKTFEYSKSLRLFQMVGEGNKESTYYLGAINYKLGKYLKAEAHLRKFVKTKKGLGQNTKSLVYWGRYYLIRSLEKQKKFKEAYNLLVEYTQKHRVESYYRVLLRISKRYFNANYKKIKKEFLNLFPNSYTTYLMRREDAFDNIKKGKIQNGLGQLKKAYKNRQTDYRFIEAIYLNSNCAGFFLNDRDFLNDYFYFQDEFSNIFYGLKPLIESMEIHNSNVLSMGKKAERITNLFKPFRVDRDDLKRAYMVSLDPFFSNYYLNGNSYKTHDYFRRLKLMIALDHADLAENEIKKRFENHEYLRYSFLTYLHNKNDESYKAIRESINLVGRREKFGLIPYDFLREAYPLYQYEKVKVLCESYNIPKEFVYAVMREESMFNKRAVSYAGATGLMQIMNATGRELYEKSGLKSRMAFDLMDPDLKDIHLSCV